jgi:hypothetical protein
MFVPYLVSEQEAGGWEDCVWATGVMLGNAAAGADVHPATRSEYEALRVAGGDGPAENPGDGSRLSQLLVGLRNRYGLAEGLELGNGWPALLAAMPVGSYAALNGHTSALPARLKLDACRNIAHTLLVARDQPLSMLVLDPCRRNGSAPTRATNAELGAYHNGLAGAAWLAYAGGSPMTPLPITDPTPVTLDVKDGAQLYLPDLTPKVKVSNVNDARSPFGTQLAGTPYRACYIETGGVLQLLLARTADCTDVRPIVVDPGADDGAAELKGRRIEWARWATAQNVPLPPGEDQA